MLQRRKNMFVLRFNARQSRIKRQKKFDERRLMVMKRNKMKMKKFEVDEMLIKIRNLGLLLVDE